MARRTKEEAEKTRRSILEAAFAVFTSKGFARTRLSDVAAAAGVTRGAIYWHFKDKVQLFLALAEEIDTGAEARPQDMRTEHVHSLEDLRREILLFLEHFTANDRYAVFYEMVNHKTEYTEELKEVLDRQRELQRGVITKTTSMFARLKMDGSLRCDLDPHYAALSLVAFVVGLIELWLFDKGAISIAEIGPPLVENFLRGIMPA